MDDNVQSLQQALTTIGVGLVENRGRELTKRIPKYEQAFLDDHRGKVCKCGHAASTHVMGDGHNDKRSLKYWECRQILKERMRPEDQEERCGCLIFSEQIP